MVEMAVTVTNPLVNKDRRSSSESDTPWLSRELQFGEVSIITALPQPPGKRYGDAIPVSALAGWLTIK